MFPYIFQVKTTLQSPVFSHASVCVCEWVCEILENDFQAPTMKYSPVNSYSNSIAIILTV